MKQHMDVPTSCDTVRALLTAVNCFDSAAAEACSPLHCVTALPLHELIWC